jgi:hypothetical protein
MNPQLIIAGIIAALGFGSAWQIQSWRYGAKEAAHALALLNDSRNAAARDIRRIDAVISAQNASAVRAVALRRDAYSSRAALVSLSNAADEALRRAQAGHDASLNTATAAVYILKQCGKEYAGLAEVSDRHVNDLKTIAEAWPK